MARHRRDVDEDGLLRKIRIRERHVRGGVTEKRDSERRRVKQRLEPGEEKEWSGT